MQKERNVPSRWAIFGRRLQELRKANKLSQVELGSEFGMTDVQVSRLENGKSGTTFETVVALEARLNARPGDLVNIAFPGGQGGALTQEEREVLDAMHRVPPGRRSEFVGLTKAHAQILAGT